MSVIPYASAETIMIGNRQYNFICTVPGDKSQETVQKQKRKTSQILSILSIQISQEADLRKNIENACSMHHHAVNFEVVESVGIFSLKQILWLIKFLKPTRLFTYNAKIGAHISTVSLKPNGSPSIAFVFIYTNVMHADSRIVGKALFVKQ